ncbi:MAG TPA: hypothetical protein VK961_22955 [Chthoniobacter sp.]|nr:hypothetical protein [Chthoniobacter sp.]
MYPLILPENVFTNLLMIFAVAPLLLLFLLPRAGTSEWQWMLASFTFFLPVLLVTGLWGITNGQTKPSLGDIGIGVMICSAMWSACCCIASFLCGLVCVRTQRWALLWMIPEALFGLFLLYFVYAAFSPSGH